MFLASILRWQDNHILHHKLFQCSLLGIKYSNRKHLSITVFFIGEIHSQKPFKKIYADLFVVQYLNVSNRS